MVYRDCLYGDIQLTSAEERVVGHKYFQRLHNLHQLAFVYNSYPAATHTRFEHSIGAVQCVTDMYRGICRNDKSFERAGDLELLRMMALVHDIGHAPYSHASEGLSIKSHEDWLPAILESMSKDIILPNIYGIPAWQLISEVYLGTGKTYLSDKHLMTLHSLMDGCLDADKLDYLARDALHCGVLYGRFEREDLLRSLVVVDGKVAVLRGGISALESFILARYFMFTQVYTNPEEQLRRRVFREYLSETLSDGVYPDDLRKYMALDDMKYMRKLSVIDTGYKLLYDGLYNEELLGILERRFGGYIISDIVYKEIFDDEEVYIYDKDLDVLYKGVDVSPVLRGIEGESLHRMRFYTRAYDEIVDSFRREVRSFEEG